MRAAIWDLPTRAVHWLLVPLIAFSWWSAHNDHLPWHRLSGYTILGLILFRLMWGVVGPQTSRFGAFLKGPRRVWAYVRGAGSAVVGHNPLGALSAIAMLGALTLQVSLGLFAVDQDGLETGPLARFVSFDAGRTIARLHGLNFYLLLSLIVLHLTAIGAYAARGKNLVWPMITGRGPLPPGMVAPRMVRPWIALPVATFAALTAWFLAHGLRL